MFSTIYDKNRAHMHHRPHPFHLHQSFANYGTETMQKTDLRNFGDDLLHNLHGIPDPLRKNLADTIITSENLPKTKKKLEEPLKMSEEEPKNIPTVHTSALSGILSFISGVFNSVSGAMFRPRSPVYYDCFNDGDWHYSKSEQDKIGTESPVDSSEMNTCSKTAVAACEGKLNQVRHLLSSPRSIGSVWVRKRPRKAFVEPGSIEENFEDAFSPEDFINLPNDSFIMYYSPYSYQNEELFGTGALKTKTEKPVTGTTNIITAIGKEEQEKVCNDQEKQMLKPESDIFRTETDNMKLEKENLNLKSNTEQENQEKLNFKIVSNTEHNTMQLKESLYNGNQTIESTNEPLASKDEVDYIATDKHQLISSCEDKLSKLKALLCKTRNNQNIKTAELESTKPIPNSKTIDKHYKNPNRTLDKRKKSKIKKSIQDDIIFANEIDQEACVDESINSPINSFTPTCLGDYFDEVTGRFRTTSTNSDDSFQIVFNDTPRVRLSSDCKSEDSFIVFEDSAESCYTNNDVFQDSDSETESEASDSGCRTLTCKLSHSLSHTVSNLTDDSLYAESSDETDFSNIEKVLKCDEILMNHNEFKNRSELKDMCNELKDTSDELKATIDELRETTNELECVVAKKTGLLLNDERKKNRRGQPVKKVHFSTQPPKVHLLRVWSFAARQARAGHWERYAVDRERFRRRIADVDMAVSWVLKPQHRARIKFQRFMPWWNQQRRAELAEKKQREEEDRKKLQEIIDEVAISYQNKIDAVLTEGETEIQSFYKDSILFVTGGSGFLEKQLIEKLFRHSEIRKAYILIRPKKGKTVQERLNEMLEDQVFNMVRKKKPNFNSMIVAVEGDVSELKLGLNNDDWNTITEQVDIIFNMAATIRFDEKLKKAVLVNVRGTRETVTLAKACKNLRVFIHVSTAFSHATCARVGGEVKEEFYDTPMQPNTMIELAETVDEKRLDGLTESLIKDWPNTYCFTKAIAEDIIRTETKDICAAVVRPSIVIVTYHEPEPGWIDYSCMYGPSGFVLGSILGIIRVIYVNSTVKLSFVPVDFVNNATIAAGWDCYKNRAKTPRIFHISSTNCGVTFRSVSVPIAAEKYRYLISPKAIWYGYLIETNNRFLYTIYSWLLHLIPAYIVDGVFTIFKIKKPKELNSFVGVYSRMEKLSKLFSFFLTNEWNFDDTNLASLTNRMSERDRQLYNFDIASIDWNLNSVLWCLSLRKYVIKDHFKISKSGIKKQKFLKIANLIVLFIYLCVIWSFMSFIFRLFY